jgi:hypothetical protein
MSFFTNLNCCPGPKRNKTGLGGGWVIFDATPGNQTWLSNTKEAYSWENHRTEWGIFCHV